MTETLPETVLQFGCGHFLRAFADLFVQQVNDAGQDVGRVVAVQSTDSDRARRLNAQGGRYHVAVRGLADGRTRDEVAEVRSLSRALDARTEWEAVRALGQSPDLRWVVSNTTEVGQRLDAADRPDDAPPRSFPAKLLQVLNGRFEAGLPGVTVLPCELIENNGDVLRALVREQASLWGWEAPFLSWLESDCVWPNTLVDRIVTGRPAAHPLLDQDPLLIVAEPYALWAIEDRRGLGEFWRHPAILRTPDVTPYFLRKVRILNAAHTALLGQATRRGMQTVREAVVDPEIGAWLRRLLFEEIVPTLEGRVEAPETFARQTLEQFANPFLDHKMSAIATNHAEKVRIRLVPTRAEYIEKFGRVPPLLDEAIGGVA